MYVREGSGFNGPITRYTPEYYPAPLNFSNTGSNVVTPHCYGRMGVGYGEKGLAVAPDKKVAVFQMHGFAAYYIDLFGDTGSSVRLDWGDSTSPVYRTDMYPNTIINLNTGSRLGAGGIKYDLQGNYYFGTTIKPADHRVPAGFAADMAYQRGVGSVIRYAPGDTGSVNYTAQSASNSDRIYRSDFSPFSGGSGECQCRSSRFDVDAFGRLFIPSGITQKVAVVDNNDNLIMEFGEYGNWDSQGEGSLVPTSDIPFAWPVAAAVSENYLYVTDMVNTRLARIKMAFELDNMPGFSGVTSANGKGQGAGMAALASIPDPFNPTSRVTFTLPAGAVVDLSVFDLSGRLVKTLATGAYKAGAHHVVWNAEDGRGGKVSAGVYVYRLTAGNRVLVKKTILAK